MMMVFSFKSSRAFFSASGVSVEPSGPATTLGGSAPAVLGCAAVGAFGVASAGTGATETFVAGAAEEFTGALETLEAVGCGPGEPRSGGVTAIFEVVGCVEIACEGLAGG